MMAMMSRFGKVPLFPGLAVVLGLAAVLGCSGGGGTGKVPSWLVKPPVPAGTDLEQVFRHNNLGVAYLEQHRYAEAGEEFEKAVAAVPGWAEGQYNAGVAAFSLHENARAEEQFRKALAISPSHPYAHYSLGLALKQDGKTGEAMAEFRKVLEVDPGDPDTNYNIGLLYARDRKHAEAVEALRKTLAVQPTNVSARFRLASSLLALGKKEEGDREMSIFREMNGTGAALSMGLQYSEQGKYSFAVTDYRAFGAGTSRKSESRVFFSLLGPGESGVPAVPGGRREEAAPARLLCRRRGRPLLLRPGDRGRRRGRRLRRGSFRPGMRGGRPRLRSPSQRRRGAIRRRDEGIGPRDGRTLGLGRLRGLRRRRPPGSLRHRCRWEPSLQEPGGRHLRGRHGRGGRGGGGPLPGSRVGRCRS